MTTETKSTGREVAQSAQPARHWRIRMKYKAGDDVTKAAWQEGIAGIWYGAWNPEQFENTLGLNKRDASEILTKINSEAGLSWAVEGSCLDTASRFWQITGTDWVFTYFDDSIHLARVVSEVAREVHPTYSRENELFKYRRLGSQKSFALAKLPDCFRLLSSAGQSNIHELWGTRKLIELLANSNSESDVCTKMRQLSWDDWLETLGPRGWEALCLGYLILETEFVPTGLDVGGTLPLFDLIGKNRSGHRIYAQCKKNPDLMTIDDEFIEACRRLGDDSTVFLFSYKGCVNSPAKAKVVDGAEMWKWFTENENGKKYKEMLRD